MRGTGVAPRSEPGRLPMAHDESNPPALAPASTTRPKRERSTRYPGVGLAEVLKLCAAIDNLGVDGLAAAAIASALGYTNIKTNTFSARLSAARARLNLERLEEMNAPNSLWSLSFASLGIEAGAAFVPATSSQPTSDQYTQDIRQTSNVDSPTVVDAPVGRQDDTAPRAEPARDGTPLTDNVRPFLVAFTTELGAGLDATLPADAGGTPAQTLERAVAALRGAGLQDEAQQDPPHPETSEARR